MGDLRAEEPGREGLRELLRERELFALAALQIVVFFRPLFLETFFFRDLHLFAYFQRLKVAAALAAGSLPLWDATLHGGQPLLANVNNTALYPSNLLYLVLPPVAAFNVEIVLHLAAAGVATYVLARVLTLPPPAALVAALAYEFCGPTLSLVNLLNRLLAVPWTPVVLLFFHLFLVKRRGGWLAAAALAAAIQVLAGFPELTILTFLLLAAWALPSDASTRPLRWRLGAVALVAVASASLAAVQILPTLHLLPRTARGAGLDAPGLLTWSVDPRRTPELVLPGFLGPTDTLSDDDYWGRLIEDQGFPYLLSLTFGLSVAVLAVAGASGRDETALSSTRRRLLFAFAAGAILLSLGRHLPGASGVAAVLPARFLRYPVKFISGATLPLALLAGVGTARLARERDRARRFAAAAAVVAVSLGGFAALELGSSGFERAFSRIVFHLTPVPAIRAGLAGAFGHAALVAGALGLALLLVRSAGTGAVACRAIVCVVAADLLAAGWGLVMTAPRQLLGTPPAVLGAVRAAVGNGSLYRAPEREAIRLKAPSNDVVWLARRNLDILAKYTAAGYGIPVIFHLDFDGLVRAEVRWLTRLVQSQPWEKRVHFLAAAGVSAVLSDEPVSVPGLEPLGLAGPAPPYSGLHLYGLSAARPPASLVTSWRVVPSSEHALAMAGAGAFDPAQSVLLSGVGPSIETGPGAPGRVAEKQTPRPGFRRLETESALPAALVLTTPFFEGWSAKLDDRSAPVLVADGFLQAVLVPPGLHVIELRYWPPGLTAGLAVSAAAAVSLALLAGRRPSHR